MATVRRGNVILTIKDSEVDRYSDLGYDVLGSDGEVVKKSIPSDPNTLKVAYQKHIEEIRKLKEEIQQLKSELSESGKTPKTDTTTTGDEAPVKTRRKRTPKTEE